METRVNQFSAQDIVRFWRSIIISPEPDGCWLWALVPSKAGYGMFVCGRKWKMLSHRAAWLLATGEDPGRSFVCHRCDNPRCVNPNHLFLGTHTDNMRDMIAKGRNRNDIRWAWKKRRDPAVFCGEWIPTSKLTASDVVEIRRRWAAGETQTALGREFGVTQAQISNVVRANHWKHLG